MIILLSGDGDFDLLVQKVRKNLDKEVEVYGVAGLTADSLISSASKFIPIDEALLL